jgi:4-hydroxy-4-methyl-2-oxoglutarate aldolase
VEALRAMAFPVWSRWVSAQGTTKHGPGVVNGRVVCAGQMVEPGDVIVADDDGVVCIAAGAAAAVAHDVTKLVAHEAAIRERLAAGELSLDILGLREAVARAGIPSGDR